MLLIFGFRFLYFFYFVFVAQAASVDTYSALKTRYLAGGPIKILLVPGHDDEFSGASFNGAREADLNLQLARTLAGYLSQDPKIKVTLERDQNGYNQDYLNYFNANVSQVMQGVSNQSAITQQAIKTGEVIIQNQVPHANATTTVVQRLYVLNNWIDTQGFDLVMHIHFNDYGSRYADRSGKYSGFSIYVPDSKLLNATTSKKFGDAIGQRLSETLYKSNYPAEKAGADKSGAIPDFYLIAMGAYNSVAVPRALVEYSYIYEPQLQDNFFAVTANVLARGTASGIFDFLAGKKVANQTNLDYFWQKDLSVSKKPSAGVLALQYALSELGFYPAKNLTRVSCPFTGIFGNCTTKALNAFQASRNLSQTGMAGPATRQLLNQIFTDN